MKGYFRKRGVKWSFTIDLGKDPQGKRKQKSVSGFKTKKEAQKACAELIAQIENGGYKEPSKITLGEFITEYMENHVKHEVRPSTFQNQLGTTNQNIIPNLGSLQLQHMTPLIVQEFYTKMLNQGYKASYIRVVHAILSKALKRAFEWDMIPKNISSVLKPPRIPSRSIHVWDMETVNQFLSFTKDRELYIIYVLATYTGMRKGEILGLRWDDCDLKNGRVNVNQTLSLVNNKLVFQDPKTKGSKRTIPLPEFALHCLKKHKLQQNQQKLQLGSAYQDHDLVISSNNGEPLPPYIVNYDFKKMLQKASLPKIRFHDLRHSHATILLKIGENPKVVSERLGHTTIGMTLDTYSHVLPDMQKSLADNFDTAMQSSKKSSSYDEVRKKI
ncbi:Site-specific recombinase XerD [Thermoactinomyces sp. DSM 45891]|uniref:site-specific integrase n=1 Tax=Thermoactinomyces sp. DSM 45891 TaxID=1761907 RepID=UPI00092488D5|nr:tyrosine-type recombinase/integrase [Thermoactinomyces sp. DSM 45891]SFX78233.1 Site-specific recombinase XerD [Thermoactinomyces sp. DSM 45891]